MSSPGKPEAKAYSASAKTTNGLSPLAWGDKCFLCGNTIGEAAPRGFYQGKNAMMLCHRGCLQQMETHGGTPKDFHAFKEAQAKKQPPAHDAPVPVHADIEAQKLVVEAPAWQGPRSIRFDSLEHMQAYILQRGAIPTSVRVAIGETVLQAGG
jgi:hypothetical protein